MTILDDKLLPKVDIIIDKFGKVASLRENFADGDYTAATGAVFGIPASHSVKVTPPFPYEHKYIDGDLIEQGDMQVLLSAKALTDDSVPDPQNGWRLTIDTQTFHVISTSKIYSGESIAAWQLQLRGGKS